MKLPKNVTEHCLGLPGLSPVVHVKSDWYKVTIIPPFIFSAHVHVCRDTVLLSFKTTNCKERYPCFTLSIVTVLMF